MEHASADHDGIVVGEGVFGAKLAHHLAHDWSSCFDDFGKTSMISPTFSKATAEQIRDFCWGIRAPLAPASAAVPRDPGRGVSSGATKKRRDGCAIGS